MNSVSRRFAPDCDKSRDESVRAEAVEKAGYSQTIWAKDDASPESKQDASPASMHNRIIRKVKCDEEKPICRRCSSTGRTCDGYAPGPTDRRAPLSPYSTPPPPPDDYGKSIAPLRIGYYSSLDEKHINRSFHLYEATHYEYFQTRGYEKSCYCSNEFLRISLLDHYARNVTIAQLISAEAQNGNLTITSKQDFFRVYGKGLRSVRSRIEQLMQRDPQNQITMTTDEVKSTLVALIRLVNLEQMRGRMDLTTMHMNMLTEMLQMFNERFFDDLKSGFDMAGLFVMMRVNGAVLPNFLFHVSNTVATIPEVELCALNPADGVMTSVHSPLQNWYKLLGGFVNFKAESLLLTQHLVDSDKQEQMQSRLESWLRFLNSFEAKEMASFHGDDRGQGQCAVMKVHILAMMVQFLVLKTNDEIAYDRCLPTFRTMLEILDQVQMTDTCPITIPWLHNTPLSAAFLIAVKCRDPQVRRRAIRWMKDSTPSPVWWHGPQAAVTIARRIIAIEEEAGDVEAAQDVKAEARVRNCSFVAHEAEENHTLDLFYEVYGLEGELSGVVERLTC